MHAEAVMQVEVQSMTTRRPAGGALRVISTKNRNTSAELIKYHVLMQAKTTAHLSNSSRMLKFDHDFHPFSIRLKIPISEVYFFTIVSLPMLLQYWVYWTHSILSCCISLDKNCAIAIRYYILPIYNASGCIPLCDVYVKVCVRIGIQ